MKAEKQVGRYIPWAVVAGFLALVAAVAAVAWATVRSERLGEWVVHTYEVELALADFRALTARLEAVRRGYLLDPDDRSAVTFRETRAAVGAAVDHLDRLTRDNPRQIEMIGQLRPASERQSDDIEHSFAAVQTDGLQAARAEYVAGGSADIARAIREISARMIAEEKQLLDARREREESAVRFSYVVLFVASFLLLLVAAVTAWTIRRNLRDLKQSRNTLRDLNANLEGAVVSRTADLQRANDEIQRFAYIVSHDLRSPLVNVMGFTAELDAATKPLGEMIDRVEAEAPELVTSEAKLAVREDLPEAIGFIRSSTQKMDRLINAILRLSREGRRVITPEALDIGHMADGIVASLRHRLNEIGAEVEIVKPMPGVVSDRVAVEQILSNLVENAVKYLKPGRPGRIVVRGRREGGRLVYEIEDNGRGIDPKDHERIFDLFRRSGTQDQPGEGIGLAHVRALAYRLGGMVSCESQLDRGATFAISMPPRYHANKEQSR